MHQRRVSVAPAKLTAVLVAGMCVSAASAGAQQTEPRPTGLPKKISWTFNLDAGLGAFGFANSLYTNSHADPSGDLSDNWFESYAKPALTGTLRTGRSRLTGKLSVVGERTFAAPPPLVGTEASSFQIEDAYLQWSSGTSVGKSEDLLQFTAGRAQYRIGHGFILWDGGGEGGSRGGFWSNARKAWQFAGVGRVHAGGSTLEAFYLDRDEVPEANTHTRLFGGNYEFAINDANTLGVTYLSFQADPTLFASRDGMSVINARAFLAPLRRLPGLAFEGEYAREDNGSLIKSMAWTAQASYELSHARWKPRISYRYASFEGDDPNTPDNESFDMLLPGFYDWGTWWQGEIAGEYFLSNSNLNSHQVRLHVTPSDAVSGGLIGYSFSVPQPVTFGSTSKSLATELDAYVDWKINSNIIASFVAAYGSPGDAAAQAFGRTSNFSYGMIYVAYAF